MASLAQNKVCECSESTATEVNLVSPSMDVAGMTLSNADEEQ